MAEQHQSLMLCWDTVLQMQHNGIFDTNSFQQLFAVTWRRLLRQLQMSADGLPLMDTRELPLILRVYEFSRRRELPQTAPRREFEAAVTLCEGLVDTLSGSEAAVDIADGYLNLCVSWDVSKVIHIDRFEEEFSWLCRYYQEHYGY